MKKALIIIIGFLTSLAGFTQSLDPVTLSTNGTVEVIEKSGDTLFVGGSFSEIGYSASYVSLIDPATNLPTSDGPFLNSSVYANISDGSGGWYIGGFFTTINGEITNRVAHILPNLSVDQNFDCEVNGLAESFFLDGSDLYIGGSFTTVNSLTVNRLVRVNATTGAIDGGWLPEVTNGTVNDIIREGDFVYVGGTFTSIEGTNDRRYLTRFSVTTGLADDFISVNSTVNDLLFDDNSLYVGGAFSSLSYFKSNLAFFNEGEQIPLFDRDDVNSTVDVILSDGNGGWYIGGSFFTFGSTNSTRLIHLNSDGSLDTDFQPETINSTVASLHLDGNELYLGGFFTSIGGNPFNRLARMDATTGAIDATWLPNLANGSVNAIRTSPTEVIIGGTFTTINASNNNRYFARLDRTTGATISAPSVNSTVHDFEESSNGVYLGGAFTNSGYFQPNLGIVDANTALADQSFPDANSSSQVIIDDENGGWFIGGSFSTIEGQSTTRLTHILSDYSIDPNFNCSPNSTVEALFLDGNDLYIGGSFSSVNGVTITRLAKVNATDGTVEAAWNPAPNSTVLSITDAGDNILAGGFFTAVGGRVTDRYMIRVGKASGETIQTLAPNSTVITFEPSADGLYAGGSFTEVGYYHPNLARLSGNSTTPNRDFPTTNSTVLGVIDDGSGGFYMHGQFTQVNGVSKTRIAHILADGSVDLDFDANINNTVNDIFLEGNDLYVGGTFTSINSQSAIRVAKLNATTGELETDFTPDVNSTVESVSFDNGVLYIGGSFTLINGITRNRLAALDANGDPTAWDPNVNSTVLEIKSFNGSIYVGGSFNTIGGITSNRIAAIDPITGALESFDAGSVNSTVNDFEFSGTSLFIGGSFTSIEGNTRGRIAELNANTGALQPLDISFNSTVEDIAVSGNLLGIGGFFTTIDGASQPYFAEIDINTNTLTDRILGLNSFVYGLNYEGSDLILAGSFNLVGSSQIQRILEYDPITDELTSFNAGTVNGSVEAIHLLGGELFIGGSFTSVNGSPRQRLASIDPETASVNALDVQFNSTIQSLDSQDDRLYAAGFFTTVNGNNDRGVVAIDLTDGTLADWDANPSGSIEVAKATPNGIILGGSFQYLNNVDLQRLAEFDFVENNMSVVFDGNINSTVEDILLDENDLYLAGSFSQVDGETRNRFALINTSNGSLDPLTLNLNSTLFNLHLDGNTLYLGGSFTTVNDIERGRAASYDLDTDQLTDWNPRFNNTVNSIGSAGSMVIVGGAFSAIGETLRNRLLSFSIPDGNLNDLSIDIFSGSISSMDIDQNDLYIGGGFTTLNGETRQRLASLNKTTGVLNPLSLEINNAVNDVDVFGDELFFGGSFTQIDGNEAFRAGSYDLINQQLGNFNPKLNSVIRDITAGPSGIFISGDFTRLGFESRQNFAAVSASTSEILDFASAGTSFGSVKAIAVNGDAVYIGGNFSFFQGESRNDLAAISRTDGNLLPFNPDMSGSSVETLLLDGNMLYAGGLFTAVGGTPRTNLADINAATGQVGTIDLGTNSTIYDLEKSGSTLFLSGSFSEVDGETRSRIAAINTSNNTLLDFDGGANSSVFEIELDGSLLYAGGDFTTIGGISRARLASISTTDAAVSSWNPNLNGRVRSIEIEENYLFASGDFSLINSEAGGRLTLLDKNSGDILLDFRPILNSTVVDVLYDDGKLYAGGFFTQIGSNFNHPRFARWSVPPPGSVSFDADIVSTTDFNGFDVACSGDATAEVEISVNGGTAPYTYLLTNNAGTISRTGALSSSSETATESDLPAGNYNLTVEDNTSGLALASINITEPAALDADLDQIDDVSTPGGTEASLEIDIDGGTLPYDYSYSVDGAAPISGQIISNDTPTLLENLGAGNYVFSFVDANGCTTQSSITIDDYVPVEVALTIFDEITCSGDADGRIRIIATEGLPPYSYVLDSDDDTFDRTGTMSFSGQNIFENDLGPGTYTVAVTDATGAETTAGPITLSDPEVFTAVATVTSNVTFLGANDGEILLTITGGVPNYFYSFTRDGSPFSSGSTSSSTDDVLNLPTGVYVFTLTDANGCQFVTDPVEVLEGVDPCADLGGDADNDGICDDLDPCVGEFDAIGVCNGDCEADDNNNGICDDEELGESNALLCSDGIDNDGDGFVDCDDPECQEINNNLGCTTCFGDGLSFADVVLDYENTCPSNVAIDPEQALGVPDFVTGTTNFVTLGRGSVTLGFTNNTLINSGNSDPDLFVFEIGPAVEGSSIELRPLNIATENILIAQGVDDADGDGFYDIGSIGGSTASVDIDAFIGDLGFNSVQFDAIQITDIPGSCSGTTPGADIDAVCALSSLPCVIGESCDDGNPNTENDVFDASCNCVGTPICLADAGSLSIVNASVELDSPVVSVSATTNGDAVVPSGFSTLYVLTSGAGLIIEQTSGSPTFMVDATGLYTIHTLVYNANPADPDFLDLSGIVLGTTPASEVLAQINDNDICADLDVTGAEVTVIPCDEGDTDGDGFCDDVDPCPLLADLENGDACGANGTVVNCECVEVCTIELGTPVIACLTETAGSLDNYTVTIPYTGVANGATISLGGSANCTNAFIEISGDDPTTVSDGTIILTSTEEISCWSISIQSQSCDVTLEGDAPSCDPGVDCPNLGLNNGDACGTNGEGTVVDCECLLPDCNGTLGGTVFDTDGDGICDDVDNCLNTPNDNQTDLDGDGEGDACDNDIDGDGVINTADCAPLDANFSTEQTFYADNDGDGFGNPDDSQLACEPPTGFVDNDDDCDDDDENINPDAQTLTFVGTGNFTDAFVSPLTGSSQTQYNFSVVYTDATGSLPAIGFPRVILDFEGNGNFTGANDRTILLTAENSNDLNTVDGKTYIGSISALPSGTNYEARVLVTNGDCQTELGPFDYPDVLVEPDLEIFADDISFSDINPPISSTLEITALIRNVSDLPANNFSVDIVNQFDESIDYPEIIVPTLAGNSSTILTWEITTPDEPAWCPIEVFVDNTNVIVESNELDNRAIRPFVNGDFEVPGDIIVDANVSPSVQIANPGATVTVFGFAEYIDTAIPLLDPSVAGGTVTIESEEGATYTGLTNSQGFFSIQVPISQTPGVYTLNGEVTDFTLTGTFTVQYEVTAPINICLPDLRTILSLNESQIFTGESTGGTVTVTNIGCAATEISALLDLYQTGGLPLIADETIPPLQPGESVQFAIEEITFDTPGTYSVCGLADAEFLIVESSESNNTDCASVNVIPPFPDIIPVGGPFGSQFICFNNSNPSFTIRNNGGVETGFFEYTVDVFLEGAFQASFTQELDNIAPFSNVGVSIPYSLDQLGLYTFNIDCDIPLPGGIVVEFNEDNNTADYSREVRECQPDLLVLKCGQLEVEPVDPEIPGEVTYIARVRNIGNATAEQPIEFEFTVSDGTVYQVTIDEDIAPNQTVEVSTVAPSVQSGEELLTATADPNDLISEFIESNNSYADSLCWEFAPVPKCGSNWWTANYSPNQTVVVSVGLDVDYLYKASAATVRFEVEGPGIAGTALLGDVDVENAKKTCNCPYVVTLPNSFIFTDLGTYTFTFTADPDGEYEECDETNNVLQVEVEVTDLADLRILSEFINPTVLNPALGESVFFDITYENIGVSNPEDEMNLRVLVDEEELGIFENVPGLIFGENTTIAFPVPYSTEIAGAHIVRAVIDSDDEIDESNELNNEATRAIVVGEAANLFFDVFLPDDASPSIGQAIAIDATIGNNGSVDVSADVIFSYVTDLGDTVQIGSIPVDVVVDGSQAISLPWNVQDNNTTLLGEIVNATEIEFNYDDNFASAELGAFDILITSIAFCEGETSGSLMASAEGGNPPYTFSWSNGFIGETLEAEPGMYSVTVTDNEGFEATASGTIGIDETCVEPVCDISAISFTVADNCDPITGLFDVSLTVAYENQPDIGFISVNGQDFGISGSPQTFDFEIAEGAVNFDVSFTENEDCSLFIMTGVIITPCEEDCEGVFGGDALPGSPCVIGGENGFYNDNCECIPQVECSLIVNSFDITDNCDPETGLYTAFVELSYNNAPISGVLVVNEVEFEITESPQTVSLDLISGPVVFEAFFSENPSCNTILDTGITLEACEEDCEGVFGGTALPGTPCELAGAVGIYNIDCECIPNVGCTADGGSISTQDPMAICKGDGNPDPIFVDLEGAVGENSIWVVTAANGLIVDVTEENVFDFEETTGTGICVIWHLSWDGEIFGLEVGENAFDLEGDCFDLSNPLEIFELYVNGGEISVDGETTFCTDDGEVDIVQVTVTGNVGPNGRFLLTDSDLNVLQISQSGEFDFEGAGEGLCLIWYAAYGGPITLPESGTNVVDIEGCFSLSNAIEIEKEECDDPIIADCDNWRYFLSDNKNSGSSDIYEVILDDESDIAEMTLFKSLEYPVHIAYNESGNELYLVRSSSGSFRTLDVSVPDGALSAEIPLDISLSGVVTTTFDASGNFYIGAESTQAIYIVNQETGATTEYTDAAIAGGDIAFGTDGELYHVTRDNGGRAIKIDPEGDNEDLGSVPDLVTGLAARNDGNLMISTRDRNRLYVGDTDAMYLNKFYILSFEGEVFTMSNGDMASGCADNEPSLQSCELQAYYYANHGPGISGTDIYEVEFSETEAELTPVMNLPYQAHIAHSNDESNTLYFVNANGNFLEIYDVMTATLSQVPIDGDIDQLYAVVFNPNDELLYVGDDNNNKVYTIDPITGETSFFVDAPISGGDLALSDGELFLAKRDSDDLFKLIEGSFVDIGSIPNEVNGMSATEMLDELMVASAETPTFSRISNVDGGLIAEYTAFLGEDVFTLSNGDLTSGCLDPNLEPACMYQLFYAHQSLDGVNALLSLTANGEGGFDTEELAMNIGNAHIAVLPNGNELFVVDGSGTFKVFDLSSQTFGEEIDITAAEGNISGTPAAVATPDGFLIVASSNRNQAYLVNPETGLASEIGREIPVNGGDLVFDSEGTLWYINRNTGTFYDVYGEDEFSVPLGDINGAALLDDGSILLAEGNEENIMYGVDMESQALNGAEYTVPVELYWGDLAGQCLNMAYLSESANDVADASKGWIEAYPNPNEGITSISFETATDGMAVVEVFDMTGRRVDELYSGFVKGELTYRLEMNRSDLPNGVYLFRLTKADEVMMGKFIISK